MVMGKHVLFISENESVPGDLRVWSEARALRDRGYEVSVISPKGGDENKAFELIEGIRVYRHPMPIEAESKVGFLVEYLNALIWEGIITIRIFFSKPFQIIHGGNPPDLIFLVALMYKLFGVKYVFDHHDIVPENYLAKFGKRDFFYWILCLLEKLTFSTADIVISTNNSYKHIAVARGKKRESEVFVVRNGPDLSRIAFVPPNEKLKDGFDYMVAYVGVIGSQEGIDVLLEAVKYIVYGRGIHNIKFIIVGKGPHWRKMSELSKKMKLEKFVTFTGFIPYIQLYEVLATADVCVNPEHRNSFTDKSTMMKIMDYMVFGKPIVQFDTKEGRVTAGDCAIYVRENDTYEFADAIVSLLNNPRKREKMGEIGKKRMFESLNWDRQEVNLQTAYEYLETKHNIY